MSDTNAIVIVEETPRHIVEVYEGVQGKRGVPGPDGPPGPIGPESRPLTIVLNNSGLINVNATNHAEHIICTNQVGTETVVVVGYAEDVFNGETLPVAGASIILTQVYTPKLRVAPLNGDITIITEGQLSAYKQGSSIGLISVDVNTWVLLGSVALNPAVVP